MLNHIPSLFKGIMNLDLLLYRKVSQEEYWPRCFSIPPLKVNHFSLSEREDQEPVPPQWVDLDYKGSLLKYVVQEIQTLGRNRK